MNTYLKRLATWRPGKLLRNTFHASGWNIARILLQAGSLVLMTHVFGAKGYGALAGVTALYITLAQFVGLGSGVALVRSLARSSDAQAARMLATKRAYLGSGLLAFVLAWPCSIAILGDVMSAYALAYLAVAELIAAPTLMPFVYWHQARENMFASGAMVTLAPIARICAAATTALVGTTDLTIYAALHLGWLAFIVTMTHFLTQLPHPYDQKPNSILQTVREGLPYAISGATLTAGNELDKTILLRTQGDVVAGQYTAAYRIMQAATLPVNSLILAATPRMFKLAADSGKTLFWNMLIATTAYALLAGLALGLLSPYVNWLLGEEFVRSSILLRIMCFVLLASCIKQLVTAQLTVSDRQKERNVIEAAGLLASITLLVMLTPTIGAIGAIIAMGASDLLIIFLGIKATRMTTKA
jgi:O-antigen/teichoic acid export membrane protein